MVDVVARQIGDTFLILWITPSGLGRKVTARNNQTGAQYHREVAPGDWRSEQIRGSSRMLFTRIGQLQALVPMLFAKG